MLSEMIKIMIKMKKGRDDVVSLVCLDKNDKILIIKRTNTAPIMKNYWDLPGGHVDLDDSSFEEAVVRELKEETNLKCDQNNVTYASKEEFKDYIRYYYFTRDWSGQIKFKKNPESGFVEHNNSKWVSIEQLKSDKSLSQTTFNVYLLEKELERLKNEKNL